MMGDRKRLLITDLPSRVGFDKFTSYDDVRYASKDFVRARIMKLIFSPESEFFGWSADVRVDGLSINNIIGTREPFVIINRKVVTESDLLKTKMEIAKGWTVVGMGGGVNKPWWRAWR